MLFYVYVFVGCMGAIPGSMWSIRREWHEPEYYATYVRPKYLRVMYLTGVPTGVLLFLLRSRALS